MASAGNLLPQGSFREGRFWNEFFEIRKGKPFEWYVEWENISHLLAQHCDLVPSSIAPQPQILVPGCGNSELSAQMYDAGFHHITNIDFCKAVIKEMLHKHARLRPGMLWRVMDMTRMQFSGSSFDVILDKGGLDALLGEPEEDPTIGMHFLSEVKRVLRPGGRYACVTLAQKHVLDVLFPNFRCGWSVDVHMLHASTGASPSLLPFLVIARNVCSNIVLSVHLSMDRGAYYGGKEQLRFLEEKIEEENGLRHEGKHESNGWCRLCNVPSERDVVMKAPSDLNELQPGRRVSIILGGGGQSRSTYRAIMLDAENESGGPVYQCAVFLVPKGKAHDWLFSSEEGQWKVLESAKAGRLIMVFLDVDYLESTADLQDELSPLVKDFLPPSSEGHNAVPYLMSDDGIQRRTILEEIDSSMTGAIFVEDVIFSKEQKIGINSNQRAFRRLIFKRNPRLIQSEALLNLKKTPSEECRKGKETSHRRGISKYKIPIAKKDVKREELMVDHSYLASPYHGGVVAGLSLIASSIEKWLTSKEKIEVMVIGLGAGLLPMFIYKHLPVHRIQVVEIDPIVGDLAKRHFSFIEDERMQLQLGDGVAIVQALANLNCDKSCQYSQCQGQLQSTQPHTIASAVENISNDVVTQVGSCLHILVVDADSPDSSKAISCPPLEFLEAPFLQASKKALLDGGILAINFVSRVAACREFAIKRLCEVFEDVYELTIDEDVNCVLFALPKISKFNKNLTEISSAAKTLLRICTNYSPWDHGPNLSYLLRTLRRVK